MFIFGNSSVFIQVECLEKIGLIFIGLGAALHEGGPGGVCTGGGEGCTARGFEEGSTEIAF